jgi:Rps23 Pro-64 3,4-dihydroxylase Tpa1-like proline 4-hydroxylase
MKESIVNKLGALLPIEKLDAHAEQYKDQYNNAEPYAHAVIDNVFDEEILREIISEFEVSTDKWKEYETKYEKKLQLSQDAEFGSLTRIFLHALNSDPFIKFLEKTTGIYGLLPDMSYAGGGLHSIPVGGKLGVHVDFNYHKELNVFRRLNVILYLNENWKDEYGGALEMWNADRTECVKSVLPVFNRMVIFTTTSTSYHGHPHPLTCPDNATRKSLALYYYTAGERGEQSNKHHSTVWINEQGKTEELGKKGLVAKVVAKLKSIWRG